MDYRGDPDMVLPQGEQWDDRGIFTFHNCFNLSIFFVFKHRFKTDSNFFLNADVRPQRPANLRVFERRHPVALLPAPQDATVETLAELEQDLERLTEDIPETSIDDIPIRLQRYVVAVP